jgi:uncharacterized membrane protein
MNPYVSEWANILLRWAHIFAAILWVGTTYYFTWLDGRFTEGESKGEGAEGEAAQVWMVHSGGFYVVEKQKGLERLPRELHWFRWEAALTWLTGMALLILVYYMGGALIDKDVWNPGFWTGIGTSLGLIIISGVVYDVLVASPLGRNERTFAAVACALTVGLTYLLSQLFSGRAAYIHVGVIFGTIMAANVWMHILPAQRRMVAALREGRKADETLGARAKLRSKHNTFMAVPVVFTMISHHFTSAYGHEYNWAILSALVLAGWVAAKFIRRA